MRSSEPLMTANGSHPIHPFGTTRDRQDINLLDNLTNRDAMDTDRAFDEIRKDIAEGRTEAVAEKTKAIAESDSDPMTRVKCLSLLKVVEDAETSKQVLAMLMDSLPEDRQMLVQTAGALRGLEYPSNALSILRSMDQDESVVRMSVLCLMDLEEYEEAYDRVMSMPEPSPFDRVMKTEILSALGRHSEAVDTATALLEEYPQNYQVRRAYVASLLLAGREKDAVRYARAGLKDKSADSNAIAAFALRIAGNYKAAAGYATRAIKIDNGHVGAMETLGICLAWKGEYDKARIVAGAINEKSPGDKAALNVLSYCEGH